MYRVYLAFCVLFSPLLLCGCGDSTPNRTTPPLEADSGALDRKAEPDIPTAEQFRNAGWEWEKAAGIPFYLVPVRSEVTEPRPPAAAAIAKLLAGLESEKESTALLQRLHGGATIEFVVVEDEAAKERRTPKSPPPAQGRALFWAITKWKTSQVQADWDRSAGTQMFPSLHLAWTYLAKLEGVTTESQKVLILASNDYFLRHKIGYQLRHGAFPGEAEGHQPDPREPIQLRADLDRQIEEYVKSHRAPDAPAKE